MDKKMFNLHFNYFVIKCMQINIFEQQLFIHKKKIMKLASYRHIMTF